MIETMKEISNATLEELIKKYNPFKEMMLAETRQLEVTDIHKEVTEQFFTFMDNLLGTIENMEGECMMPYRFILIQIMVLFMSAETDIVLLTEVLVGFQERLYRVENLTEAKINTPLNPDEPINGRGLDILRELEIEEMEKKIKN